jgi:lysophospholipase L1-like esterase
MNHVVLLGDSIFDNKVYVGEGPDVATQLRRKLNADWKTTLLAVDGSMTTDIWRQIERIPVDATHLIISIGGNDALNSADILNQPAYSVADALRQLATRADQFEYNYHAMLQKILERGLPTALCSIYYPRMPEPEYQRIAVTALTVFNDVIIRAAFAAGLPLIDLRLICVSDADYANPIEPSVQGGERITDVIKRLLLNYRFDRKQTVAFI